MFYTRPSMQSFWKPWAAAGLSAVLLELPFPIAGPMAPWRSVFAWFGLVPLLWTLLAISKSEGSKSDDHESEDSKSEDSETGDSESERAEFVGRHPLRRAFFVSYFCGVLWYVGNCSWIYQTMHIYGGLQAPLLSSSSFFLRSTSGFITLSLLLWWCWFVVPASISAERCYAPRSHG